MIRGRRPLTVAGATGGGLLLVAAPALAYWTLSGIGEGTARSHELQPPGAVQVAEGSTPGTLDLSWSAPTTGPAPSHYSVANSADPAKTCTPVGSARSCSVTSVPEGASYSFTATAHLGNWNSAAGGAGTGGVAERAFVLDPATKTVQTGTPFNITVSAQKASAAEPDYTGTKAVTWGGTYTRTGSTLPTALTFTNGVATASVTLVAQEDSKTLTLTEGLYNGSMTVTVTGATPLVQTAAPSKPDLHDADDSGVSSSDNITNVAKPRFTGTAAANSMVRLYRAGVEIGSQQLTGGATSWTIAPTETVSEGSNIQMTATAQVTGEAVSHASGDLPVTFDRTAPAVTGLRFEHKDDPAGDGQLAKDDLMFVTYSSDVAASTICSSWNNTVDSQTRNANESSGSHVSVTLVSNGASNDNVALAVGPGASGCPTFRFGQVATNANYKNSTGNQVYGGNGANASTLTWTKSTGELRVSIGTGGSHGSNVGAAIPTYTPASGITDIAGNALPTTAANGTSSRF